MKADTFTFQFQEMENKGSARRVTRVTDLTTPSNHLYFTQRSFTPDSKKVVFLSERDGGFNLFSLDIETRPKHFNDEDLFQAGVAGLDAFLKVWGTNDGQ